MIEGAWRIIERSRPILIFEDWSNNSKTHFDRLSQAQYEFHCLGWLEPFSNRFTLTPPIQGEIQVLAALPFALAERSRLPERVNVLATPSRLTTGVLVERVECEFVR